MRSISSGARVGKACWRRASSVGDGGWAISGMLAPWPVAAAFGLAASAGVFLHQVRWAEVRLRRVAARFGKRASLAKQVPTLVELGLHRRQALVALGREGLLLEEPMLLGDQLLDVSEYGLVLACVHALFFHGGSPFRGQG